MSFRKRVPALTAGALIALSPLGGAMVASPAAAISAEEQAFVDAINASRTAAGLAPLTVSEELSAIADLHSARMAGAGTIFHSSDLESAVGSVYANWTRMGENVGMGSSVQSIHSAMLASPNHAANIYGDYNLLGVGVTTNPGGVMFVTQIFAKAAVEGAVDAVQPAPTTAAPAPAPAPVAVTTDATASSAGAAKSNNGGSRSTARRTRPSARAGGNAVGAAHMSATGAARNAAHSGGRRGAPEWAQNDKK